MKDNIIAAVVGIAIGTAACATIALANTPHHDDDTFVSGVVLLDNGAVVDTATMPACASEDATDCYWDAASAGNGEGRSFVDVDGTAFYVMEGK